ncbi:hypothetical protein [Bradyrhizobium mercantei]|uniref:hypothetical protein n=1 Tax=Bradyrhizobium mercantei TaxID=1904807 RepID=UPI0013563868|nr:hypothetical protein [Bradyrhizobium mercantei]
MAGHLLAAGYRLPLPGQQLFNSCTALGGKAWDYSAILQSMPTACHLRLSFYRSQQA